MGEHAKFKQKGNSRFEPRTVWLWGDTEQTMIIVDMIIRGGLRDRTLWDKGPLYHHWRGNSSTLVNWISKEEEKISCPLLPLLCSYTDDNDDDIKGYKTKNDIPCKVREIVLILFHLEALRTIWNLSVIIFIFKENTIYPSAWIHNKDFDGANLHWTEWIPSRLGNVGYSKPSTHVQKSRNTWFSRTHQKLYERLSPFHLRSSVRQGPSLCLDYD